MVFELLAASVRAFDAFAIVARGLALDLSCPNLLADAKAA